LLTLGFAVSERTISRWIKRASNNPGPARRWLSFLRNHREAIAAMDFFSVPTVTFGVLFFIIAHDRRRILRYNVTRHPTSAWVVHQLREAFPYEPATQFLILDHDSKYGTEVSAAIRCMNIKAVRTAIGCPWQNGVAERWVDSCRRELLDHVIAISESHLKRLLSSYVAYYHSINGFLVRLQLRLPKRSGHEATPDCSHAQRIHVEAQLTNRHDQKPTSLPLKSTHFGFDFSCPLATGISSSTRAASCGLGSTLR
jgi:transposase InsO family protein